jgi:hypothetical protein
MNNILSICSALLLAVGPAVSATFHVAPGGNDTNAGTKEKPLATLEAARDAARKADAGSRRIVVMPGEYFLAQPLVLDARDNGLTIEAEPAGKATLYGGKLVTNWKRDGDRLWQAELPGVKEGKMGFPRARRERTAGRTRHNHNQNHL